MASQNTGPETGVKYTLTNNSGHSAVFNDTTSADYVGGLAGDDAITGLDSPEVREAFSDLAEADGAIHGNFYHGRRPITLSGQILGSTNSERNGRLTKLQRATNSLQGDGTLTWTPSGSIEQFCYVRKQQPTRIAGAGTLKSFFVALVAADPRIYSTTLNSVTAQAHSTNISVENKGSYDAPFESIKVIKPTTAATYVTGFRVRVGGSTGAITVEMNLGFNWGPGGTNSPDYYLINTRTRSVQSYVGSTATNRYNLVNFTSSTWTELSPGTQNVYLERVGASGSANLTCDLSWRDVWM